MGEDSRKILHNIKFSVSMMPTWIIARDGFTPNQLWSIPSAKRAYPLSYLITRQNHDFHTSFPYGPDPGFSGSHVHLSLQYQSLWSSGCPDPLSFCPLAGTSAQTLPRWPHLIWHDPLRLMRLALLLWALLNGFFS